jgi:ZU5 domain
MRSQFLRTWIGCCSVALLAACSASNGSVGTGGAGGTSGSVADGDAGTGAGSGKSGSGNVTGGSGAAGEGSVAGGNGIGGGQVVGTSGGTVMENGVTLVIPANALTIDTPITVTATSAPAGFTLASTAFQFGPSGTTFAEPVAVTIPLTASTPGAHLFWSNTSGGFDDIGGTVSGLNVTANVSHFSIGFDAIALSDVGAGGTTGSGGSGNAGATSAGTGGTGTGTGGAGVGGSAGSTGGAGAGGADETDAGAGLCAAMALNLPAIQVTNAVNSGPLPNVSTYTGGPITSGDYYETADLYYGLYYGTGAYSGPTQAVYMIDTVAQTIRIGERQGMGTYYIGMTYTPIGANELQATVVCNTSPTQMTTLDYYYTLTNGTLTMNATGSKDVMTLGAP